MGLLHDPLRFERQVPPCLVVIFGANGDLTRRKLMPALYSLAYEGRLSPHLAILGVSRTPYSHEQFRAKMREAVQEFTEETPFEQPVWQRFEPSIYYMPGNVSQPETFKQLRVLLDELDQKHQTQGNILFYLATQPSHYAVTVQGLGAQCLSKGRGWRRLVVEKPFGHDLQSAIELDRQIRAVFDETQVFRIDHYLGKETVQNILAFRFGNGIFEPLWNRHYIDHIQITAAESIGVEGRGSFYQETGALRDMIQNHLLQVMATVAMEPASSYEPEKVRDERAKLLESIRIFKPEEVDRYAVAGQYGPGEIGGERVPGFREEPGVPPDSQTETYAAVTFFVDNWRWAGVPFYLRTGKRLPKRVTDIAIQFHPAPHRLFTGPSRTGKFALQPNLLVLRIQPEEGISLRFLSKQPGSGMHLHPVSMDFSYGSSFGGRIPSAYETLLLDAITGDSTLFIRQDMVEASWRAVMPILEVWKNRKFNFPNYAAGTWGPPEADQMLRRNGHAWRKP